MGSVLRRLAGYDHDFYEGLNESSSRSADVIVPMVVELLGLPQSVVDVGCGAGAWLRALAKQGVVDYLGLDGDYVPVEQLLIPPDHFQATDLRRPLRLDRRFGLVTCLEVAEHLPAESADRLVADLVQLGEIVLFSAAIPYQGGIGHVNEQWPAYWKEKFEGRGYVGLDPFRMNLWPDDRVDSWFAQNLVLYVTRSVLEGNPRLVAELERTQGAVPALVHPATYASKARIATVIMDALPRPILDRARRRFRVPT